MSVIAPTLPALRYHGAKWELSPWIVSCFPHHLQYLEPFFGSGAVLLRKPRAKLETVNDLDDDVFTFFAVLRNRRDELLDQLNNTPWHRREFELSREPAVAGDDLERARRFFVRCWMSIGVGKHKSGFRIIKGVTNSHKPPSMYWELSHLYVVRDRLVGVQFESRDVFTVLERYATPDTLVYLDPPYLSETRTSWAVFRHEFTNADHKRLLGWCVTSQSMVVLSGYPSKLYDDALTGWECRTTVARSNIKRGSADKLECLWLSPSVSEALDGGLFGGQR